MISTVDEQARHTRKSPYNRKDGYRAHLVAEPGTGLVTDEALTMAAGPENSDAAVADRFVANTVANPDQQDGPHPDGRASSGDEPTAADLATPGSDSDPGDAAAAHAADADDHDAAAENTAAENTMAGGNGQGEGLTWYGDSAYGTGDLRHR